MGGGLPIWLAVTWDQPEGVYGEALYDGASETADGDIGRARFRDPLGKDDLESWWLGDAVLTAEEAEGGDGRDALGIRDGVAWALWRL